MPGFSDGASFGAAVLVMLIPIISIIGGITYAIVAMRQKGRLQELAYRERIAAIERGATPAPEVDPGRFEEFWSAGPSITPARARSMGGGVMLIGVGLGLFVMLSAFGDTRVAVGVGGFLAILGVAMLANGLLQSRLASPPRPTAPPPAQPPRDTGGPPTPGL